MYTNETNKILPAIIVLNENYFPESNQKMFKVGATSFVLETINCLIEYNYFSGLLLYKRDESITKPILKKTSIMGLKTITMNFNFSMKKEDINNSISISLSLINSSQNIPPMVYYHTDTLLPYHPNNIPCCVTHHGPFVKDFAENYSLLDAYKAFENKEKAEHLMKQQEKGLEFLLNANHAFVLQHSILQRKYLVKNGVKEELIKEISPPIIIKKAKESKVNKRISQFIELNQNELLLISTVARIDFFKNLELLVNASVVLLKKGIPLKILILGGSNSDQHKREELYNLIPKEIKTNFLIKEKLPQDELYSLFDYIKNKAIFVCTSRYETLGITPLEAALSEVCSIIPDSDLVEASRFFPKDYRFKPNTQNLAEIILKFYKNKEYSKNKLYQNLSKFISEKKFKESLIKSWQEISRIIIEKEEDRKNSSLIQSTKD